MKRKLVLASRYGFWWLAMVLGLCYPSGYLRGFERNDAADLFPEGTVAACKVIERPATQSDVPLTNSTPVLTDNWRDVPGPHGERAEFWQETSKRHGYRILDRRGRLLHVLNQVSLPRWSPDGRWLAVSRWSRELFNQLALVEVGAGTVIPIPQAAYLDQCAWSPDSRKLAFAARSSWGDSSKVGWLSVPDTLVHIVAPHLNDAFECTELAWSPDSHRFVALMHREYEHDDVRVTDVWLFGLTPGACRLTATPYIEESRVGWVDDEQVIFHRESWDDDTAQSGLGTVLELPVPAKSPR